MMSRLIPIFIAVVAIVALTLVEGRMTQRWSDSRHCAYCATLLDNVPTNIGSWVGEDQEVDERTQVVAGARGFVSRNYRNSDTNAIVSVWLIVGHSRDTARHTPNICYPSSGFEQKSQEKYTLTLDGGGQAEFFTGDFVRGTPGFGEQKDRVYWCWFKAEADSSKPVQWIAPNNRRFVIGSSPSLYKLYFTSHNAAAEVGDSKNIAMQFAREFLPTVDPILQPANGPIPEGFDPGAETTGAEASEGSA